MSETPEQMRARLLKAGASAAWSLGQIRADCYQLQRTEREAIDDLIGAYELLAGIACVCDGGFHKKTDACR